jgi:hypothetical protein
MYMGIAIYLHYERYVEKKIVNLFSNCYYSTPLFVLFLMQIYLYNLSNERERQKKKEDMYVTMFQFTS